MSHEEHILHQLKEMHAWIAHADVQLSRIKWLLLVIVCIAALIVVMLLAK